MGSLDASCRPTEAVPGFRESGVQISDRLAELHAEALPWDFPPSVPATQMEALAPRWPGRNWLVVLTTESTRAAASGLAE